MRKTEVMLLYPNVLCAICMIVKIITKKLLSKAEKLKLCMTKNVDFPSNNV